MTSFHSGLNHWQRQWLSDRLHKKDRDSGSASPPPVARPEPKAVKRRKASKKRAG